MGDSATCHDFGDCERATTVGVVQQITHPDLAKIDGRQNLSLLAPKEEEPRNINSPLMDDSNSDQDQIKFHTQKGAGDTEKDLEESSLAVECLSYCSSLNSFDAQDMTRCISGDVLTLGNVEASSFSFGGEGSEKCVSTHVYLSDHLESKMLMDVDFDMKIYYPPPGIQDKHSTDFLSSESPQSSVGARYISNIYPQYSSELPLKAFEECRGPNFLLDEKPGGELHRDAQCEVTDEDEIVHNDFDYPQSSIDGLTLDQLDDDVLYHIASFLEARVLRFALINVCQRFRVMFASEAYWKLRKAHRWPKQFPAVPSPPDFNWIDAYVEREDSYRVWMDAAVHKYHFKYLHNLFGGVDAVHLMKDGQLAVCGDRSRTLNLIDFSKYHGPGCDETQMKDMLCHTDRVIHQGWIWSIASAGNHFVTGSWDTYVRMFDVDAGCRLTSSFKCHSSVLCLYAENNETVASCSDKKVYFFDHRTSEVRFETLHTQPVLCVSGNENFIISGSEDKSISVYDRRAGKMFTTFKLKNYPLCMSYTDNQLWFGDRNGTLHLLDGTNGLFQSIGSYNIGHTEKMTGVVSTRGAIYTCSGDKTIKVLHPTKDPDPITTLTVHEKEIAKIDYNNGVLVSAGGDDCIGVWLPKHWDGDTYLL